MPAERFSQASRSEAQRRTNVIRKLREAKRSAGQTLFASFAKRSAAPDKRYSQASRSEAKRRL